MKMSKARPSKKPTKKAVKDTASCLVIIDNCMPCIRLPCHHQKKSREEEEEKKGPLFALAVDVFTGQCTNGGGRVLTLQRMREGVKTDLK